MTVSAESDPVPADFGTRFSAWMIDACLLFVGQTLMLVVLARLLQAAGMTSQEPCSPDSPIVCEGPSNALWTILFALAVVTAFGYHAWFDGRSGATPGKRWMGLRVVDERTADPTVSIGVARGFVRSVVRQAFWVWAMLFLAASPIAIDVPAVIFFALLGLSLLTFVVGAFDARGRSLHDLAGSTSVIRSSATRSLASGDRSSTAPHGAFTDITSQSPPPLQP